MKRIAWGLGIAVLVMLSTSSSASCGFAIRHASASPRDPCVNWTIYEMAEYATGAPREIIEGLHFAESSKGKNTRHTDIHDKGDFGLNSKYEIERERKHGKFDPHNPHDAAIEAGHIYMDALRALGDSDAAISAYNRGIEGTKQLGIKWSYVNMVKRGMPKNGKRK